MAWGFRLRVQDLGSMLCRVWRFGFGLLQLLLALLGFTVSVRIKPPGVVQGGGSMLETKCPSSGLY